MAVYGLTSLTVVVDGLLVMLTRNPLFLGAMMYCLLTMMHLRSVFLKPQLNVLPDPVAGRRP